MNHVYCQPCPTTILKTCGFEFSKNFKQFELFLGFFWDFDFGKLIFGISVIWDRYWFQASGIWKIGCHFWDIFKISTSKNWFEDFVHLEYRFEENYIWKMSRWPARFVTNILILFCRIARFVRQAAFRPLLFALSHASPFRPFSSTEQRACVTVAPHTDERAL